MTRGLYRVMYRATSVPHRLLKRLFPRHITTTDAVNRLAARVEG